MGLQSKTHVSQFVALDSKTEIEIRRISRDYFCEPPADAASSARAALRIFRIA